MNIKCVLFSLLALAAVVGPMSVLACKQASEPAPSQAITIPVSEETAKKLGVNQNYLPELANLVVASGILQWPKASADPSATTTTGETAIDVIGGGSYQIPIGSCSFHPASTLTASNTAYASISVYKRNGYLSDGGTTQTLLAQTTTAITAADAGTDAATGSWYAWTPVTIPVAAGAYLSPGDAVTVAIAKTGAGVVVPQGELVCYTTLN